MNKNSDIKTIKSILEHCNSINRAYNYFGNEIELPENNEFFKKSIAFDLLQIAELSGHITEEFKDTYKSIPWNGIKAIGNVAIYNYEKLDTDKQWETIADNIQELRKFCEQIVQE